MYIGELASQAGATPKAIRLYETLGLLGRVQRMGKYRIYTQQHVVQVRLIKQAQTMGFRLSEVAPAMKGRRTEPDWATLAQQVDQRRLDIAREIVRLQALDVQLAAITIEIRACAELPQSPSIATCT